MHQTCACPASALRPFLGHECATHGPLSTDPDTSEKAKHGKLPDACGECAQEGKDRIPNNGEHERSHATKFVSDWTPQKSQTPANQEESEEQSAVESNVGFGGGDSGAREQFAERGDKHERIHEGIHAVERPPTPCCPESAYLIAGKTLFGSLGQGEGGRVETIHLARSEAWHDSRELYQKVHAMPEKNWGI